MTQHSLFDPTLLAARATDPPSSREAAADMACSGAAAAHRELIRRGLEKQPGRTSAELAVPGLDRYQVARRLKELETQGRARRGAQRVCRVSGKRAVTWWAA